MSDVPVFFVLDGNAYFATATEIVRRLQFVVRKKAIAVGVGYPISEAVFAMDRRVFDMTPPSKKGLPTWQPRQGHDHGPGNGNGQSEVRYGGAASFQRALVDDVLPAVSDMMPAIPLASMRKVLFGHSFGGLFTLFSLFTQPGVFDTYIAASPSIWFNDGSIKEQEEEFMASQLEKNVHPNLYITTGTAEEDLLQKHGDADDWFARRREDVKAKRMNKNAAELADRLRKSGKMEEVSLQIFDLEDHGSSAICGLQRGINKALDEWWVGR
ncbi:hypothetical protein SEUCBS140593_006040 [Sporothrix eucalyptigena]|uniref:Serine aminopeptidase S33 domain-containing protein n=1 Tax=Sporothrix eucalyptigena TaxID=1812306 RepID=A0ABP0C2K0_9PEZI